tara:strand:- start:548 stop:937 length:390 start_codon:yes stop_codon:yes gene_type:complete
MEQPLNDEYPTYDKQVDKIYKIINDRNIDNSIRGNALTMFSEFNEVFYPFMCKLVDILNSIDEEDFMEKSDAGIKEDEEKFIKWFGQYLHNGGGLTTQQAMFYVMNNIMECRRTWILNSMWNNIGDWKW